MRWRCWDVMFVCGNGPPRPRWRFRPTTFGPSVSRPACLAPHDTLCWPLLPHFPVAAGLASLRPDHKRTLNPTPYKVSVSNNLYAFLHEMWLENQPVGELA